MVRHPPVQVPSGICYGSSDVPCAAQATQDTATTLAPLLVGCREIWSSPSSRCLDLAERLAQSLSVTVRIEPRLAEMDFGAWEMQTWESIGPAQLAAWTDDFLHQAPGDGESVAQFLQRNKALLNDLRQVQVPTACITHAGVIRASLSAAAGRTITCAQDWPQDLVGYGSVHFLPQACVIESPSCGAGLL